MKTVQSLIGLVFISCLTACTSTPDPAPTGLRKAFPSLTFTKPVDLQHAGDTRFFVVEQAGRIISFDPTIDSAVSNVFLDIRDRVNDAGNEEGLLGLAFHPNFETTPYLYVNYTADNPRRTVISRFSLVGGDSNHADANSELILLQFNQPYNNHNGGQIRFGPDGYLYIAAGDGGSGGDPQNNGQSLTTLLGKILRIDVDHTMSDTNYAIPDDNPFARTAYRGEIWAYGLRNPWRFSFDPVTQALWAADVGQSAYEEIDIIEKGHNYGWRKMEGFHCYGSSTCDTTGLTWPVWEYDHTQGQSITGGFVYQGSAWLNLTGTYIYADFLTGRIWSLRSNSAGITNTELMKVALNISSMGVDRNQELYFCAFNGYIYTFE